MSDLHYFTVSELVTQFNVSLGRDFPRVFFQGELSGVKSYSSGHVYFTVKDATSQIAAVMWRNVAQKLDFQMKDGMEVQCLAKPEIYSGSGRFQMIVSKMVPAGEGLLQKMFLELKAKLEQEGLFAQERKRTLPFLPKGIGIVTSKTGAVIHDIMVVLKERMPNIPVYLYDARVQGEGAAQEIAEGIRVLSTSGEVDVLIVGRGGGSLQDLWSFNEEIVVRAIFACGIPIISAVGHEVDVTLADLVADMRAPTPTKAAEMIVPKRSDLLRELSRLEDRLLDTERWFRGYEQRVDDLEARLRERTYRSIERARLELSTLSARLDGVRPDKLLESLHHRISFLATRLLGAGNRSTQQHLRSIAILESRLHQAMSPQKILRFQQWIDTLHQRMERSTHQNLRNARSSVDLLARTLYAVDPGRVVERGYAIVRVGGQVVSNLSALSIDSDITMSMRGGEAKATVREVTPSETKTNVTSISTEKFVHL